MLAGPEELAGPEGIPGGRREEEDGWLWVPLLLLGLANTLT